MKKILAIGEALIDFIANEVGYSVKDVKSFTPKVGGAPCNVCGAVSKLGVPSGMITMLGMDQFGDKIIEYLKSGHDVGLVSDRGTPVISDPGYELARHVISEGYNVVALPGATALIPALITSGIAPMPFTFYGFLNSKKTKREKELAELKLNKATLIFYESPHRINDTLESLKNVLGGHRKMSISREITKKYEEVYRGTIDEIIELAVDFKGEMVLVVEGNNEIEDFSNLDLISHINLYIDGGMSKMDAIKAVAKERGLKKSEVYNEYLKSEEEE